MAEEVFMDIPQVERMAKAFNTFGETLDAVSRVLQGIVMTLRVSAFLTLGGGAAAAVWLDRIQKNMKRMADKMRELSGDVNDAIRAYRDGDLSGSRRFV